MPPSINAPEPAAASTRQYSDSSSQAGQLGTDRFDPPPYSAHNPTPPQPPAGLWSDPDALSSRAASSDTIGSRAPSIPLPQSTSNGSMASLPMTQIMSSQSLASMASGSTAAQKGRSPSPVLDLGQEAFLQASSQGLSTASAVGSLGVESGVQSWGAGAGHGIEVEQVRQQLQGLEAQHEAEVKRMQEDHAAHVVAIQAQAVAKMKELIEKVMLVALCSHMFTYYSILRPSLSKCLNNLQTLGVPRTLQVINRQQTMPHDPFECQH